MPRGRCSQGMRAGGRAAAPSPRRAHGRLVVAAVLEGPQGRSLKCALYRPRKPVSGTLGGDVVRRFNDMPRRALALSSLLLMLAPTVSAQTSSPSASAAPSSQTRILVLPFENTGADAGMVWLGEASAILVADGLRSQGLAAISRDERVRAFEELHLPLSATLSRATVIKVGELLGASELVTGTFRVQDRSLTVQAHTIRVDAGRVRQPVIEKGQLTELFDLHDRLVRSLTSELSPASRASTPGVRPPLGAFENYIKGLVATRLSDRATRRFLWERWVWAKPISRLPQRPL